MQKLSASETDYLWQIHVENRFQWDLEVNKQKYLMRNKKVCFSMTDRDTD